MYHTLAAPTPYAQVGTFIAGRDLPDWAPHFLVGVGIVLGLLSTTFLKLTPVIFATLTEHPILFVALFVVGRCNQARPYLDPILKAPTHPVSLNF